MREVFVYSGDHPKKESSIVRSMPIDYEEPLSRKRAPHRSRSRDRSRHRRHNDDRSRSRRRHHHDDDEVRPRSRPRSVSPPRKSKVRSASRSKGDEVPPEPTTTKKGSSEIDDLTKDQRTVFVSQLVMKVGERNIRAFFEKIGRVKDVIMIRDKYTNRHKGFAYVEMADLESVPMILMLNGTLPDFQRFPILVKASEAEKNFLAKQETQAAQRRDASDYEAQPRRKLAVGNLHAKITEADLETVLAPFGEVEEVEVTSGPHTGKATVTFVHANDAQKAFSKIAGIELGADGPITVSWALDDEPMSSSFTAGSSDWRLDADDQGGMALNPQSRQALMAQLGQRAGIDSDRGAAAAYAPHRPNDSNKLLAGPPSAALCVANMFDPATETDPNWRDDIKEDVLIECDKHGKVAHLHVDAVSSRGLVHILFDTVDAAKSTATSLHGRWFAGRLVSVTYVDPKTHRLQYVLVFSSFYSLKSGSLRKFKDSWLASYYHGYFLLLLGKQLLQGYSTDALAREEDTVILTGPFSYSPANSGTIFSLSRAGLSDPMVLLPCASVSLLLFIFLSFFQPSHILGPR